MITSLLNPHITAERKKDMQISNAPREHEKYVLTLVVLSAFTHFSHALITCVDFRDLAAVFRLNSALLDSVILKNKLLYLVLRGQIL